MKLYLVDGTYELFRAYYGAPKRTGPDGLEVGAVTGLMRGWRAWIRDRQISHLAVAFDSVVESFRNDLYPGYKSGEGVPGDLLQQFPLAEEAARLMGLVTWPMREFEADDALATAAHRWREDSSVDQILICSPDKDFAQCVRGQKVVCYDRRKDQVVDEASVMDRFGVPPDSVPDWQGLVGDTADGYPGMTGWGKTSATAVLGRYLSLEKIPRDPSDWAVPVRNSRKLASSLFDNWDRALLFRRLATLSTDVPLSESLESLEWRGFQPGLEDFCRRLGIKGLVSASQPRTNQGPL